MNKENAFSGLARQLVEGFSEARPIHANTLLLTLYGDTVCPFGGTIWLGSLIKLVEPLGINQRLVRTSVYRLAEQGVLQSEQIGRRSYYTLTERGVRQFANATKRIYAEKLPEWSGGWQIVMTSLGSLNAEQREAVRKELIWLGFTRMTTGIYVHPTADADTVNNMLVERGCSEQVVVLKANTYDPAQNEMGNQLITRCFDTHLMDEAYQEFIDTFEPILGAARKANQLNLELCFLVRTLLIHKYRQILLHEPELPSELLPADALSRKARAITRELYLSLGTQSDGHFLRTAESGNGAFKQPVDGYYQRFGGM